MTPLVFLSTIILAMVVAFALGWHLKARLVAERLDRDRFLLSWILRAARNGLAAPERIRAQLLTDYATIIVEVLGE